MGYMAGREREEPRAPRVEKKTAAGTVASAADVDSKTLFGAARVLMIRHGEDVYTLRITRSDKLILTK